VSTDLIDGVGASPHIKIVDKVGINFTGGIVANNTTTVFEIIGTLVSFLYACIQ
jgi:hypothetical protein